MSEIWRAIPGYKGLYEVSDRGRVRSLARRCATAHGTRAVSERVLRIWRHV